MSNVRRHNLTTMQRRYFLQATTGLMLPFSTLAQQPVDGRGGRFDDDLISKLEGEWLIDRQVRGTTAKNTLSATWVLSHQFLQLHMKDTALPSRYEAIVLIGYIYASAEYVAHWTDTFGGKFSAIGKGKRVGNSIEFRFEYPDGPFFNTFTWNPDLSTWQMRLESQDTQGKRSLFALDTVQRAK
jgi:hypothetical protein